MTDMTRVAALEYLNITVLQMRSIVTLVARNLSHKPITDAVNCTELRLEQSNPTQHCNQKNWMLA